MRLKKPQVELYLWNYSDRCVTVYQNALYPMKPISLNGGFGSGSVGARDYLFNTRFGDYSGRLHTVGSALVFYEIWLTGQQYYKPIKIL